MRAGPGQPDQIADRCSGRRGFVSRRGCLMLLTSWLRRVVFGRSRNGTGQAPGKSPSRWGRHQLRLELLESRLAPATDITISTAATTGGTFSGTAALQMFTPDPLTDTAVVNNVDIQDFL